MQPPQGACWLRLMGSPAAGSGPGGYSCPAWPFRLGDRDLTCIPVLHLECSQRAKSRDVCGPICPRDLGHVVVAPPKLDREWAGSLFQSSLRFSWHLPEAAMICLGRTVCSSHRVMGRPGGCCRDTALGWVLCGPQRPYCIRDCKGLTVEPQQVRV